MELIINKLKKDILDSNAKSILSLETRHRLVLGKEALNRAVATKSMSWFCDGQFSKDCCSQLECSQAIQYSLGKIAKFPLCSFALDTTDYFGILNGLCVPCAEEAEAAHLAGRKKRLLPSLPTLDFNHGTT